MAPEETGVEEPPCASQGVITLGFGDKRYRRMAKALARSVRLTSPDLPLAVITDDPDDVDLARYFDILVPLEPDYGSGVQQKLSLDLYTPFEHTLFLDADSVVVRSLGPVFDLMGIVPFGVVGFPVIDGFYWVEVEQLMRRFGVPYIGRFNAGLICFSGSEGDAVFATARQFVADGGLEGMPTYRGAPHDEIPLSAALARHGIVPIYDDGAVMRAPEPLESRITVDARNGIGRFKTKGKWVEPTVLHFAYLFHGTGLRGAIYRREIQRLLDEPTSFGDNVRCAVSQAVFTLESSSTVRDTWKRSRGTVRREVRRLLPSSSPKRPHHTSMPEPEATTGTESPQSES